MIRTEYTNFEDLEHDLKRLKLERNIAIEELKMVKSDYAEALTPLNWIQTGISFAGKYGLFVLLKRIFK